jgi:hypothetical protein
MWREKKVAKLRGEVVYTSFEYLFQKTLIINPKKQVIHLGDAFEDTAFKLEFETVKS